MMLRSTNNVSSRCRIAASLLLLVIVVYVHSAEALSLSQPDWRSIMGQRRLLQQGSSICSQNYPSIPFNWRPSEKVVSLTFDDGPQAASLTTVLDVLKSESVPGTFFVNTYPEGGWGGAFNSPANQAALRRLLAEGHELGSHAAIHLQLSQLPTAEAQKQIEWAVGNITAVTGKKSVPLFRAPYGDGFMGFPSAQQRQLWEIVRQHHVHIAWSFTGEDYKIKGEEAGCADRLFNAYGPPLVQQRARGPVLMHSTSNAMGGCPQGLQRVIKYWKSHGYKMVKTSDMVEEIYGMSPAEVVERARACGTTGQRERSSGGALPNMPMALSRVFG